MPSQKNLFIIFSIPIVILLLAIIYRTIIFRSPETLADDLSALEEQQNTISIPYISGDPILGKKNAPITIIVFGDFGCGNCATLHATVEQVLSHFPDKVKVLWKGLPVTRYPIASDRAQAYAFCANKQDKFDEFSKLLFENPLALTEEELKKIANESGVKEKQLSACLNSTEPANYIEQVKNVATILGIQTVPAMYIADKPVAKDQYQTAEALEQFLGLR